MEAEVAIIGAGPTGCTVATYLARRGHDVLLLDRADPPTHTVGESLVPLCAEILDELGVDMAGFQTKRGAVFRHEGRAVRFGFDEGMRATHTVAWQVPRTAFDSRLRRAARDAGARFLHTDVRGVEVEARQLHTDAGTVRAGWIVDAGGRNQLLARTLGLRQRHPWLRNTATSAWFRGVQSQEGEEPGDIVICAYSGGWFWFIPFADGTWSVGTVLTPDGPRGPNRWDEALRRCPDAHRRLRGATRLEPLRNTGDISVSSAAFHGEGWAAVGDAATFLDPVFSTGIALGLFAGRDLALTWSTGGDLDAWEARCRDAVAAFEPLVAAWYDGRFLRLAFADPERQQPTVRRAIVSLLAGDVFDPDFDAPRRLGRRLDSLARWVEP